MMLRGKLYDIISRNERTAVVRLLGGCDIYSAHFPGFPITPGVTIVQIAVELLSLIEGKTVDISSAKNIKFLVPVIPREDTTLTFEFGREGEITVYHEDVVCSRMKVSAD